METLQSIHILWLIALLFLLYILGVAWYFNRKRKNNAPAPEEKKCKGDVVGKSLFVLERGKSKPEATVSLDNEKGIENKDIFVPSDVPKHPRQIPAEELDEVFGAVPEGETNEPLDIDYDSESDFPEDEEYDEEDADENEYEDLPMQARRRASGVSFEEMSEAYRHVVHNPTTTEEQKEDTGRILLNLKHTDLFEAIVSGEPEKENKVTNLIDTYLSAFHKKMSEQNGESPSLQGTIPEDFNVSDYV